MLGGIRRLGPPQVVWGKERGGLVFLGMLLQQQRNMSGDPPERLV
ncbi:putative ribosomal protein S11, mitochondrial [Iris pallida]|uniref:Ribosomal protein S11, mitochondrial n=1 Tax=Iris pallida TaxID=29817 RepID=A0AAX6ISB1_IRIPA|nr:putative ribosomal protein S11, mitochondrial [Iris pallida]